MSGLRAHPNADLDRLSLFEAQVHFRCCALSSFQFCELTFLFHPSLGIEFESMTNVPKLILDQVWL